jgi:hypothetical protein
MQDALRAMRSLSGPAAVMAALLLVPLVGRASPLERFRGNSCDLRGQLWTLTQNTATAMDAFKKDMAAAYGRNNPYSDVGVRATRLSPAAMKSMQSLDVTLTKPPKGVIPQTWVVAHQFGMDRPFGGKAAAPKLALRSVLALESFFDVAIRSEMKAPGHGVGSYTAAQTTLEATWNLLKAIRCVPPTPKPTPPPSSFFVSVWIQPSVVPYGGYPTLNALTKTGASCSATVRYANGRSPADFTGDQEIEQPGETLAWTWHEVTKGAHGTGTVTCVLGNEVKSASAKFTVST